MAMIIEPMKKDDVRDAAAMFARAFDDSPLFRYLLPSPRSRATACRAFFAAATRDALALGNVDVARHDAAVVGAAVWLAPGDYPPSALRQLRQLGATWTFAIVASRRVAVSLRFLRANEKVHPKETHWYLGILGVDPAYQGQGIGGRLLQPVLDRADAEGLPVYLETDKERNLAFYNRFRFQLVDTLHPDGPKGPPNWTMWRDPVPA
jgi:GNAT superfamily N-acetyltransferase